jgi:hypothetical protein
MFFIHLIFFHGGRARTLEGASSAEKKTDSVLQTRD